MGIRVHKAVGYGLRGFEPSEEILERIQNDDTMMRRFAVWCEEHMNEILALPVKNPKSAPFMFRTFVKSYQLVGEEADRTLATYVRECVCFDNEFGLKDAILFVPPELVGLWKHYDDFIDWAEESSRWLGSDGHVDRFEQLKIGLYPNDLGAIPLSVGAVLLYYGLGDLWPKLHEALYVYWS